MWATTSCPVLACRSGSSLFHRYLVALTTAGAAPTIGASVTAPIRGGVAAYGSLGVGSSRWTCRRPTRTPGEQRPERQLRDRRDRARLRHYRHCHGRGDVDRIHARLPLPEALRPRTTRFARPRARA